jgi:deoxycytidylate deaminase
MHPPIFATLSRIAEQVAPIKSARIVAAVVLRKKILAFGANQLRSHPFQAQFGKNPDAVYWHAETNAIYHALQNNLLAQLRYADLYVYRAKYADTRKLNFVAGNAKPCSGCFKCIADFGLKRVFYSTETGYECL